MIIVQQQDEDEEMELSEHSLRDNSRFLQANNACLSKIDRLARRKYQFLAFLAVFLLIAFLALALHSHDLVAALEFNREAADQILLLEAKTPTNHSQQTISPKYNATLQQVPTGEMKKFERLLSYYLTPFSDTDCELKRYGAAADGGYLLCENFINDSSILLNFGIEKDDSFGCQLVEDHPQMFNYQFDCTQTLQNNCGRQDRSAFHSICLGEEDAVVNGRQYHKLESILAKLGANSSRLMVKMDVEGSEWGSLAHLPLWAVDNIDQLVLELHLSLPRRPNWQDLAVIRSLAARFVPVNTHMNNFGCHGVLQPLHWLQSDSVEVTLVNRRLIRLRSYQRSSKPSALNAPNHPSAIDCQQS